MLIDNVRYYANKKSLSLWKISVMANVDEGILRSLNTGRTKCINLDTAAKIANVLDISIDELYYGREVPLEADLSTQK